MKADLPEQLPGVEPVHVELGFELPPDRWRGSLSTSHVHVEVVSVQLPGRENRFDEHPIESMDLLVGPLLDGLASYLFPRSRCSDTAWAR